MMTIDGIAVDEPLADVADRVAAVALGAPGVVELAAGTPGGAATYGPGRRIDGVRVRPDRIEVHVVVAGSVPSLPAVAAEVRRRVAQVEPGRRVDVFIDDIRPDVIDLGAVDLLQ